MVTEAHPKIFLKTSPRNKEEQQYKYNKISYILFLTKQFTCKLLFQECYAANSPLN